MRGALLSVVVCVAGAGAVGGAAWLLQTVTLPPPTHADRVAAEASAWLRYHRYSIDIFHSHGYRLRGACLRGWYPRRSTKQLVYGSLLVLDGGPVVLDTRGRRYLRFIVGRQRRDLPAFLAITAGCTSSLGDALYAAVRGDRHLGMERAYAARQPALALRLGQARGARLTIYVSARLHRPLVAIASVNGHVATARIYFPHAEPHLWRRYRRLLTGAGGAA